MRLLPSVNGGGKPSAWTPYRAGYRLLNKTITVTVDGSITVRLTRIGWDNPEDIEWVPIVEG